MGVYAIASASPAHCIRLLAEKFCGVIKSFIKNPYQNHAENFCYLVGMSDKDRKQIFKIHHPTIKTLQ
ncbi:hypothetical protein GXM_00737 [Nostoc sphaeroides CCNUC1]|uniref:Uncharacterized protein n=1 Tax=Nostoc sphaeroides CCNUC1 TaxID=2653204 RepID=A0A5P8VSH1_9NOSO|nr:hypothetical protein GXM_00737 [Nostoc sphaeroides CCNUC1]